MKKYLKLLRLKSYIKNLLIFLPIFFSKNINDIYLLKKTIIGFAVFSLLSSVVYILNDLKDVEKDKKHPIKCKRPIASGQITKKQAHIAMVVLFIIIFLLIKLFFRDNLQTAILLLLYLFLNILYSVKLKEIPIIDITVLAIGFLIRVLFGALIISVQVSNYLYLTILTASFYMAMGKRRNEILKIGIDEETRTVLKAYSNNFLNENMYMFLALAIMFYSLWCVDMGNKLLMYTVPLAMIIAMKYSLSIEKGSYGDPVDVITNDKILLLLLGVFSVILGVIVYI